jgi:hypothetical protein
MFSDKFNLVSIKHLQIDEEQQTVGTYLVHAEWRVIAQPIK